MTRIAAHRGPDDEGVVLFLKKNLLPAILSGEGTANEVFSAPYPYCRVAQTSVCGEEAVAALGHRRLSIVDLSAAGHQPMCTPDGRYWITYNGEVYNHSELRRELEDLGIPFSTKTDTEVVLQAYACWGASCLHRFNGMFAFAIVDRQEKTIFAARDRFGVKPLYMWESPSGTVALASEIKQFACHPEWRAVLNHQRAYDFLNWSLTDHTEETLFKGVKQLLGGHCFTCAIDGRPLPERWYSLPRRATGKTFEEASRHFRDLFLDAVNIRLRADVEVGSCLSGGLDSSSIVCAVDSLLEKKSASLQQKTFSSCSLEEKFNERAFVEEVVKGRRLEAHYFYPSSEELIQELPRLVYTQDEPFHSTSIFAQWQIFKQVRRLKVPVMLDGQGADEQLAGYDSFYGYRMAEQFKKLQWMSLAREIFSIKKHHPRLSPWLMLGNRLLSPSLRELFSKMAGRPTNKPPWLDREKWEAELKHPFKETPIPDLDAWGRVLTTAGNLPMLLRYEDRNSMAHSIESRTPFLDYRLVEFCVNLPAEYKLKEGWTKRILRHSMSPYLPKSIAERRDKMAFVTSEEKWMKEQPHFFLPLLVKAVEGAGGMISPSLIDEFEQMVAGKRAFSSLFWKVISFGQWMEIYF